MYRYYMSLFFFSQFNTNIYLALWNFNRKGNCTEGLIRYWPDPGRFCSSLECRRAKKKKKKKRQKTQTVVMIIMTLSMLVFFFYLFFSVFCNKPLPCEIRGGIKAVRFSNKAYGIFDQTNRLSPTSDYKVQNKIL